MSFELTKMEGINLYDTVMLYNAALMKFNEKDYARSIELMDMLVKQNYKGVQHLVTVLESGKNVALGSLEAAKEYVDKDPTKFTNPRTEGDLRPDIILMLANSYKSNGDTANYVATINLGREKFPSNERLIREELQQFLNTKQYEKAVNNLKLSLEKDPTNKVFYFILGSIYHTEMGEIDNAAQAYDKALEIDPAYADVLYMRGLLFVGQANDLVVKMNNLKMNETKKFEAYKAEQKEYFKQSLPYFEKARELNPDDQDVLKALREVYYKTGDTKKAMEIMELLGS
jgi:tetratricopeptide (TPR) repeat protein